MNPLETPQFVERVSFLNESQYWSKDQINDFQIKQLQYLIQYVKKYIPFYQQCLSENDLDWNDFDSIDKLKLMPLIDKKLLQNNYEKFLPYNIDKKDLFHRTTGGSTGTPLTIYSDIDHYSRDKANTQHYMNVFGLDIFKYKSVRLYGDKIEESIIKNNEYWYVLDDRKLIMSCYHINSHTAQLYVNKINLFAPMYIHTRPSSILPLAKLILENNLNLNRPIRYIFCDGEYLTDGQRKIIERAFQARVVNIYGHTEACTLGHPCLYSDSLHLMPQVGIAEILDSNGTDVTKEGDKGELVVTGFNNLAFPLIRYRTNDIVIMDRQQCECGRNYKMLKKVEGRIQDYVVNKNNELVPLAPAIFNYNDMDWKGVSEFKVMQQEPGKLKIQLVLDKSLQKDSDLLLLEIQSKLKLIFSNQFELTVQLVSHLEKTKIGKFRYLDQQLNIKKYME